ncbi:MAG: MFS transporter [Rickettsiaceae bacterium]|nr:MFS transporter [Rickettsiaceae bacterium]
MNFLKVFTDYKQFQIFLLGILSGMPLIIIYSTLSGWMTDFNVDISVITSFAIARIFYSLKFLWAPFVDQIDLPIIYKIGHRKSWMCVLSFFIAFVIFSYSFYNPVESLAEMYILTIIIGISSATLDVVIDAFRIDIMDDDKQSIAVVNAVTGYRVGMLISGAGALHLADHYGWSVAFQVIAALYIVGILFILTLKEPQVVRPEFKVFTLNSWKVMTIDPFADFLKRDGAIIILLAVVFYKLGDAMLGVIAIPFYMELGFTKTEIANVTKIFGLLATFFGSYLGGFIMYKLGNFKGLIIGGIAQSVTNASFIWLNHMGHDVNALMITIAIENVAAGIGTAALLGYLACLCNKRFSATQYALLSSASGLFSHSIVMYGGSLVKILGWDMYFVMTIILAIPGLCLLWYLNRKYGFSDKASVNQTH